MRLVNAYMLYENKEVMFTLKYLLAHFGHLVSQ